MKYHFKSLTPIFTGNAWMQLDDLKLTNIYGGIRFWFEVFCFNEKCIKKVVVKIKNEGKNKDNEIFNGNLSEFLFGKDGWKGLVKVKIEKGNRIDLKKNGFKHEQGENYVIFLPNKKYKKYYNKKKKKTTIIPTGTWYLPKNAFDDLEFILDFSKVFKFFEKNCFIEINGIEKKDLENIIENFIYFFDKFGFIGGKWQLGFGKVDLINSLKCKVFGKQVNNENDLLDLNANEIRFLVKNDIGKDFNENNIEKYLSWKFNERCRFRSDNDNLFTRIERHYIFGSTVKEKVIPIGKEKNKLKIFELEKEVISGSKILPVFGKDKFYVISLVFFNKFNNDEK